MRYDRLHAPPGKFMSDESSSSPPSVSKGIGTAAAHSVELLDRHGAVRLSTLVGAMANGDQGSFRQFYELTSGLVNSLALRILGNAADAEEIVVDVYSKAWRTAGSFNECRGTPLAWLLMMTRSLAIDRFRQRSSRPRATEDETRLALLASSDDDPETLTAGAEHRQIVRKALAKLSSEQQEVLRLAFYSGLSHSELATELGQPLGTVKTRIRLGLQQMKRLLEESN